MKWIFALLLSSLSALTQTLPPSPPGATKILSPKHKEQLLALGRTMIRATVVAPRTGWLVWNYPADQLTNVEFQVYRAFTLTNTPPITRYDQIPNNFSLMSTVDSATTLSITFNQRAEFFIVRARDKVSGAVSNWNVK